MDLYIDRAELLRGLGRVQGIVERHTTNMSLSHVLLSASGNNLRMTASDTMLTLVADYVARVEVPGELSVDAQMFFQIARSLSDPTVHLVLESGNRLGVHCGNADFHVVGLGAEDFPPIPSQDHHSLLTVSAEGLRRMIEETLFSVSTDESRYGLNGAHIEEITAEDGSARLRLVTTDGSRLSWSEVTYDGKFGMGRKMLLPRKALDQVRRLCDLDGVVWKVSFGERAAAFSTEDTNLIVRLVDGEFPDYRQVLPASHSRVVDIERERFNDELRHVALMASDRNHSVRFAFEADRIVLTAHSVDTGDARTEIPADLEGEPLYTGFNVTYFQDILKATKSDSVRLEMGEALDPCLVRLPDRDDCLFVVMPMRLD